MVWGPLWRRQSLAVTMAKQRKSSTVDGAERIITEKELQDHVTAESLWIVVNGKVRE